MVPIGCLHEALSALGEVVAFVKAINARISYVPGSTSMLAKTETLGTRVGTSYFFVVSKICE
jgi:hypothetical protein